MLALALRHADDRPTSATELQWRVLRDRAADIVERCAHVASSTGGSSAGGDENDASVATLGVDIARALHRHAPPLSVVGADVDSRPRLRRYARRVLCTAIARAALVDDAQAKALADVDALQLLADAETYVSEEEE